MARIEWAALSGEVVVTVVAILIQNEHPRATPRRVGRGDFGVDLFAPLDSLGRLVAYI